MADGGINELIEALRRQKVEQELPVLLEQAGAMPVGKNPTPDSCPTCRGTGGGQWNDCVTCDGNGVL